MKYYPKTNGSFVLFVSRQIAKVESDRQWNEAEIQERIGEFIDCLLSTLSDEVRNELVERELTSDVDIFDASDVSLDDVKQYRTNVVEELKKTWKRLSIPYLIHCFDFGYTIRKGEAVTYLNPLSSADCTPYQKDGDGK